MSSPNMQKHLDLANSLRELWPLIRDLPSLYVESMDAKSKREAYQLGQIDQLRQELISAASWYCLRVLGEVLLLTPEQEAKP